MADSAHLEKMGRELKCPICLSLLNFAVSLTCNHVFCNLCISKSMKSASSCPVCKVPYRRREVRPAPHMDNLVSIYKSMEVASGINIFVTQPASSIRKADGQQGGSCVSERPEADKTSQGKPSKQTMCKQKGSHESEKNKELNSHASVKPSFPAKKRIQVPLSPPGNSETPVQPKKMRKLGNQDVKDRELEKSAEKSSSITLKEKPDFNREGNPVFTPFFWLREQEEEDDAAEKRLSQQTDVDWVSEIPRRNTPSFSDLLDSDDESSEKMDTSESSEKRSVFDSEMFEWTQRALSPELCCTPVKKKIADELRVEGVVENRSDRATGMGTRYSNEKISCPEDMNVGTLDLSCQKIKNVKTRNSEKKTRKNGIKPKTQVQKKFSRELKRLKSSINQTDGTLTETLLEEVPTSACQVPAEETLEKGFEHVTENHMRVEISHLSCQKIKNGRTQSLRKKSRNNGKKSKSQVQKKALRELRKLKRSTDEANKSVPETVLEKVPTSSCQIPAEETLEKGSENVTKNCMNMEIPHLSCQKNENNRTEMSSKKSRMNDKITNSRVLKKPSTAFKLQGSIKRISNAVAGKVLEEVPTNSIKFEKSKNITVSENENNLDGGSSVRTLEILPASAKDFTLHSCENVLNQIRCAFCRLSTDSEASGQMLHYFGGKPVAADYNGGSNIIHSHKSCAEWAPNVYFEDETAKNLTAEIVRSTKIKCSSCGIRGASLGCFEKSCRKSFHVTCAKLIPQCRWDDENFVMLCPVHSSSKLPKEIYGFEKQSRKRSSPKVIRESKSQLAVELCLNASKTWKWPSGSPSKWLLCCSALSDAEKEVVTEFTRLAGIPLSKTWIPSVTHVIASTDENGACRRTLKVLMGILEGKWILSIDWIKECMMKMEPVDEEKYEIRADIHGVHGGPRNGRIRITEMKPKLFNGFKFYFNGDFVASYKGYLHDLVVAAGGTVLQRKPIAAEETFIIYSLELPEKCDFSKKGEILDRRHVEAQMLASATGAKVASNTWILDSIAACELQTLH